MTNELERQIRLPKIVPTGIAFPHELVNILLINTRTGYEKSVIDQIDSMLFEHHENELLVEWAHKEHIPRYKSLSDALEKGKKDKTFHQFAWDKIKKAQSSLHAKPAHATLLGRFDLASVFTATGFSLYGRFSQLRHVISQQYIIASVPMPAEGIEYRADLLIQDPDKFLPPYDHSRLLRPGAEEESVFSRPLLAVCQLHEVGLYTASAGGNRTLATFRAIEKRLTESLETIGVDSGIRAMILVSHGWSEWVVLLRGRNVNHLAQCVEDLRTLRIADVYDACANLPGDPDPPGKGEPNPPEKRDIDGDPLGEGLFRTARHSFRKLKRVVSSIVENRNNSESQNRASGNTPPPMPSDEQLLSHNVFAKSLTIMGCLWPFADDALQAEREAALKRDKDQDPARKSVANSDRQERFKHWAIQGDIEAYLHFFVEPAKRRALHKILREVGVEAPYGGDCTDRVSIAIGMTDVIVPGTRLVRGRPDLVDAKEMLARLYYLVWTLLQEPTSEFSAETRWKVSQRIAEDQNAEDCVRLPWAGGFNQHVEDAGGPLISDCSTEIQCSVQSRGSGQETNGSDFYPIGHEYHLAAHNAVGFTEASQCYVEKLAKCWSGRCVSRQLVDAFRIAISLWFTKMVDVVDANSMMELANPFQVWTRAHAGLMNRKNSTKAELEEMIKDFTIPFSESVVQRFLTSYAMSELVDVVTEHRGGLCKVLTGLDGLIKGALSLVGDHEHAGALVFIEEAPGARIQIRCYAPETGSKDRREHVFAIARLNWTHMAHPPKITTVLHEALHAVVVSDGFRKIVANRPYGGELLKVLAGPTGDSPAGLMRSRIEETSVEYLLAWLTFHDNADLYCRVFLVNFNINAQSHGNAPEENAIQVTEHVARCVLVWLMLKEHGEDRWVLESVKERFEGWWGTHGKFVPEEERISRSTYRKAVWQTLKTWISETRIPSLMDTLAESVHRYFGIGHSDEDLRAAPGISFRGPFLKVLRTLQEEKNLGLVQELLWWDESAGDSYTGRGLVDFDFRAGCDDRFPRCPRVRRLESFASYLMLIRAFHEILDKWHRDDVARIGEETIDMHTKLTKDGKVSFEGLNCGRLSLDKAWGVIFMTDQETKRAYHQLRTAFIQSMWHLAETSKLSDIVALLEHNAEDPLGALPKP